MTKKWTATNSEGYESPAGFAVDIVVLTVLDSKMHVLVQNGALPGGFVGPTESAEDTVQRKLTEKTGVGKVYFEQLRLYSDPRRDHRGWIPAMAFLALVPADVRPADSAAQWVEVASRPEMAFDHDEMIEDAIERLQGKLWWSNVAVGLLPAEFTMSQARVVYSAIAEKEYDPSTFARDLKKTGLIEPTGNSRSEGRGRPAAAFRFRSRELSWGAGRRRRVA